MDPVTPKRNGAVDVHPDEPTAESSPWDHGSLTADVAAEDELERGPTTLRPAVTVGETPTPSAQVADDAYLPPGMQLGEYRIESKIGEGGMGVVYSAVHPLIGKRAAVKVLKAELCRVQFNVERFIDEARIVNQIGHPNIVDVFAFGQTADGRSYFVMEWLKGESMRERIARERLELPEICEVIRPLARALEAAHEQGVIHRDLKPDNIFLVDVRGEAPLVKLLDFGIAKLSREEHRMERTATGAMVGTPLYIAPEQAKGYAIDHRVDIYALGGILFELLTGRTAYVADNAMEIVAKHLMEPVPRPSDLVRDVPPELDDLVVRMLAKDADARPTLAEVATVIERTAALDRTNVKATPAPASAEATLSATLDVPVEPEPEIDVPPAPEPVAVAAAPSLRISRISVSELTETIRKVPRKRSWAPFAAFAVTVVLAIGGYVAYSMYGDRDEPVAATVVQASPAPLPVVEPPPASEPAPSVPPEPAPEPAPAPAPPPAPAQTKPATAKPAPTKPARSRWKPRPKPVTVKKLVSQKPGSRVELQIFGASGTPKIRVDGRSMPGTTFTLAPGTYSVMVTSAGTKPKTVPITVAENETKRLKIELEPTTPKDTLMEPGTLPR